MHKMPKLKLKKTFRTLKRRIMAHSTSGKAARPLSPHLQVYRPQITSVMSITHRATGVALSLGSLLLVAWLWAVAYNEDYFIFWQELASQWWAHLMLAGWTFAVYYHLANGIRHLFWDMGKGFDLKNVTRSGLLVVLVAAGGTLATWLFITSTLKGKTLYELYESLALPAF